MCVMTRKNTTDLTNYIKEELEKRSWSIRTLAMYTEMSSSGLSAMLRGKSQPTAETLAKIAHVLEIDNSHLLALAGYLDTPETQPIHPAAAYIAQRLSKLPPETRDKAIEAVGGVIDAFCEMAQKDALYEEIKRSHPKVVAEAQEKMSDK